MTDDRTPEMDDPDVVAAELVLGLLQGEERAQANRRLLADPVFATKVDQWRRHFGVLFEASPDVSAPTNGLSRLMAALGGSANDNLAPVQRWKRLAALSSLAAAALLLVLVVQPRSAPTPVASVEQRAPQALLVTQIIATDKGAPTAAIFDPSTGALRLAPAMLVDARHSAELWVIAADGVPHSLGVLATGKPVTVAINGSNRSRLVAGSVLAVTVEPIGGSPDGKPTGAVVAKGALSVV